MLSLDDFDHVRDPHIRNILGVWLAVRGDRPMPPRRAIDPAAVARELEIIWVCDVVWPGPRFRYRLAGERVNAVYGRSLAGLHMDEIVPVATREPVLARYQRVVVERGISHTTGRLYLSSDRIFSGERIVVPLSEDGENVDAIL
ncbi:MAG: PAS domain-containing protein, partial [Alphaproteobacteria bacterium]